VHGGKFPPYLVTVTVNGLAVCEGYVQNHEVEAARGWDAMQLLRGAVPNLLSIARGDRWRNWTPPGKPPWD
jgi:hypothetical protein